MSGRGAGLCAGFDTPGYANPSPGRGFGMGWGRGGGFGGRGGRGGGGRGWRNWFHATGAPGWSRFGGWGTPYAKPDPEMEKLALKREADALQAELEQIKERLSKIESDAAAD
jgi:hypothetical protein